VLQRTTHNYSVADFLELRAANRLVLNTRFQRRSVWRTPAKVYLIDSILRGYPIPKLFFRSTVDPETQSSVREIVDGQQRLNAIFEFADDQLELTERAEDLEGKRYSSLDTDQQSDFLSYSFVADQLINATDSDVLEVFSRINTYNVALNPAELRHARYQGEFKWRVHEIARSLGDFWEKFGVLSVAQRARMADDALVADLTLQVIQGPTGGEASRIDRAYRNFDPEFPAAEKSREIVTKTIEALTEHVPAALVDPLSRPPHFVVLFAAAAHTLFGIGIHQVDWLPKLDELPARPSAPENQDQWDAVRDRLLALGDVIEMPEEPDEESLAEFWRSSRGATVNLARRRARFPLFLQAFDTS
jgi:hypothetical protein